jgi:hypothetical protein
VHGRDGDEHEIRIEEVRDYVDESRNPGNRRDAASVEIELPAGPPPGVTLVDVPGSGSVHRHNTDGPAEQSRRAGLRALRARLRQIEGEAPPPEAAGPNPAPFPTARCL